MSQRFPNGAQSAPNDNDVLEESKSFEQSLERLGNWRERIVHTLLVATSIIGLLAVIAETVLIIPEQNWGVLAAIVAGYLIVVALTLFRRMPYRTRATAFLVIFYLIGLLDLAMSGLSGDGRVFMLALPLLSLVLLGQVPGIIAAAVTLLSIAVIGGLMSSEILPLTFQASSQNPVDWITGTVIYLMLAGAVFIPTSYVLNQLIATLSNALEDAQRRWLEVRQLSRSLERQVADRTKELARRSEKLEAAVQVSREVASIREINKILNTTVRLISERFAFYHAGIFLLDESESFAILRAVSSQGGRKMLEAGHRLEVGKEGIVGHVSATGRARIALDVGEDAAFFDNPHLPYTRSEMALPLQIRDNVIGVLDVQSTQEAAFSQEDIATLQTMADQIALAIENAQLLEESERARRGLEAAYGEYTGAAMEGIAGLPAFEYDRIAVTPAQPRPDPDVEQAMKAGQAITSAKPEKGQSALVAPLRMRDERVIGAIALEERRADRTWTPEEIELVEAVSAQVAQALESASFYQMEQRRRRVSDTLREITRVVGSTLDLDEVINRLLDQLATLINFETASIQLIQEERRELIGGRGFDLEAAQEHDDLLLPISADPLIAEAVETKRPVILGDVREDDRWEMREETSHVRSWLAAPLVIGEQVIGLLVADHPRPGIYDEETGELVSAVAAQAAIAVQNARLYNEAQTRAREQEGLARVAALAGASLELDELIDGVMREARDLLSAEACAIMLEDEEKNALIGRYVSVRDVTIPLPEGWSVSMDAPGFENSIFARGGDFYSNLGRKDPRLIPAYKPYMQALNVENFCGVAIRIRERSVGEMYLVNREGGFGRHEAQLLRTVASYIGNAIENARLFQETERREQQALALYEAAQLVSGVGESLELQGFFEHLSAVGNFDRWWVTVLNQDKSRLEGVAGRWEDVSDEEMLRHVVLTEEPNNPVVIAIENRETIIINDPEHDERLADLPTEIRLASGKYVTEPLIIGGNVIGAISIGRPVESRDISNEDVGLARTLATQVALAIENARLFDRTQAALVETDALYTVGRAISRLGSLQDMLNQLASIVVEQLGYTSSWVALIDEESQMLRGFTGTGAGVTDEVIQTEIHVDPAAHNPAVWAAMTGETLILNDVLTDERAADLTERARESLGRMISAPITVGDEVVGIISVSRPRSEPALAERDAEIINAVADQAAVAVQNVRLLEETQQRVEELAMLFRTSEALAGAPLRADQIAEITVRQFVEVMSVPEASISLLNPKTGYLDVIADVYKGDDTLEYESLSSFKLADFPATARAMETQQPLVIQRSDPEADPAELAYMEEYDVQTLVIIPLAAKGESIGVIELEAWGRERTYTPDQLNLAMTLANQVAVALENARLFEETRQRAERERLISDIAGKIRASTNLDTIIQTTAQELGRALGTARVLVRVGVDPDDLSPTSEQELE